MRLILVICKTESERPQKNKNKITKNSKHFLQDQTWSLNIQATVSDITLTLQGFQYEAATGEFAPVQF